MSVCARKNKACDDAAARKNEACDDAAARKNEACDDAATASQSSWLRRRSGVACAGGGK